MQIYLQPKRRQIYRPLTKICPGTVVDGWGRSTYRHDRSNILYTEENTADGNVSPRSQQLIASYRHNIF